MKVVNVLVSSIVIILTSLLAIQTTIAVDIVIDGNISDWGLSKLMTNNWSNPNTWIPDKPGISFFVEDNQDKDLTNAENYNPDYIGVHIYGNSTWQAEYHESYVYIGSVPGTVPCAEPINGLNPTATAREPYDLEAIYITENDSYIFILIVTSDWSYVSSGSVGLEGDLALNFWPEGDLGYEYGINFYRPSNTEGDLYGIYLTVKRNSWIPAQYYTNKPSEINFSVIDSGDKVGTAIVAWSKGNPDYGISNAFIEVAIPKDVIGNPTLPMEAKDAIQVVWYAEHCGNESGPSIPEFMLILIPVVMILALVYLRTLKK